MKTMFANNSEINEKRISFIETVIARLARRSRKTVTVVIPPFPISACIMGDDVRGDILGYMFCLDGAIDRMSISLNAKPKNTVNVEARIVSEESERIKLFYLAKKNEILDLEESVKAGEKVIISIYPRDPEERLTEVWAAFAWTPVVSEAKTKQFLIDDIEKSADEAIE